MVKDAGVFEDDVEDYERPAKASSGLSVFIIVMMVFEILAAGAKALGLMFTLLMPVLLQNQPQIQAQTAKPNALVLISDALVLLIALPAAIGILLKKPWARPLGWVAALVTLIALVIAGIVGFLSLDQQLAAIPMAPGTDPAVIKMGAIVGMVVVLFIRLGLLIAYCVAVSQFGKWLDSRGEASE